MLTNDINDKLFYEWADSIVDEDVRAAFWYVIGLSAGMRGYECRIQNKGEVRDFRFYDGDGKQPFSFITNQRWLLFYFRKPAIRSKKYSAEKLAKLFDSLNQTSAGEWTIKIKNVDDAHRIAGFLGWLAK